MMDENIKKQVINAVLYGDIHETPLAILTEYEGGKSMPIEEMDEEQYLRTCIAATLLDLLEDRGNL